MSLVGLVAYLNYVSWTKEMYESQRTIVLVVNPIICVNFNQRLNAVIREGISGG